MKEEKVIFLLKIIIIVKIAAVVHVLQPRGKNHL